MKRIVLILLTFSLINCSKSFESYTQASSQTSESELSKEMCRRSMAPNPPQKLQATATSTTIRLSWTLSSSPDVTSYEISRDNNLVRSVSGTMVSFEESGRSPATSYTYSIKAKNNCGLMSDLITITATTSTESVAVTTVSILSPTNGNTVSGRINATASIVNNILPITAQWQIDGVNFGATISVSPYQLSFDTLVLANGDHQLTVLATDTAHNIFTKSINITVNNLVIPPPDPVTSILRYAPATINYSAPEIVNSFRGLYKWRGQEIYRLNTPTPDVYDRYTWRNLETSRDVYDFTVLENAIAAAAATGAKFGFRIRSMLGYGDNTLHMPDYMSAYAWRADTNGDGTLDTYVPDWNHSFYLDRAAKLLQALGQRYGNDPRVSWLDIGLFGQWGEWTVSSRINYSTAPNGVVAATQSTKRMLIDAHVGAFPKKQLVIFLLYSNFESIMYAYNLPTEKPIGSRVDCLGQQGFFNQWTNRPEYWNQVKERWRVAPFISEYCSGALAFDVANSTDDALGQVETFHVSMIGNGNIDWSSLSSTDQNNFINVGKRAGYRLSLTQLAMPGVLTRGQASSLVSSWMNMGVAPIYEAWSVIVELRNAQTGGSVFQKTLNIPLKSLLPASVSTDYTDSLTVPSTVATGSYEVVLKVADPTGYRRNMYLSNEGASSQIDYLVGTVQIK